MVKQAMPQLMQDSWEIKPDLLTMAIKENKI
jgi:hypothetical protein